ncbi:MAG: hypothetical protein LBB74_10505 [Chitinispirillales bacterium]|jgi:hypothetical protein|nr:hypothetical protein [Chitinispirillales bacterium]
MKKNIIIMLALCASFFALIFNSCAGTSGKGGALSPEASAVSQSMAGQNKPEQSPRSVSMENSGEDGGNQTPPPFRCGRT